MEQLSVKIKIADREYPMKVRPEDEEKVRNAGKVINERLKKYKEQFGLEDKQDLLAMVAFDSLVDLLNLENNISGADDGVLQKVDEINQLVSQVL
ncbi:MAG TPA: cell division protein ZapA [Cyclobacteriaceae bacterium]|jgi:cell division protein ZapA